MRYLSLLFLWLLFNAMPAFASEEIFADVSQHVINVTMGFHGSELIVFGSKEGPGDIAIVVKGPMAHAVVRKKSRILGFWVNTDDVVFDDAAGFYAIATSRPLKDTYAQSFIAANGLSLADLNFPVRTDVGSKSEEFRRALIERRIVRGFYSEHTDGVTLLSGRLFRSTFSLPSNVPIGAYQVYIYLLRGDHVVEKQQLTFSVDQTGLSATIFETARSNSVLYSLLSLIMAIMMGAGSAWLFRRMS